MIFLMYERAAKCTTRGARSAVCILKVAIAYKRYHIAGVCCVYKLQGENVTCRGCFNLQHASRRSFDSYHIAAKLDSLAQLLERNLFLEHPPFSLVNWDRCYAGNRPRIVGVPLSGIAQISCKRLKPPQKTIGFIWD